MSKLQDKAKKLLKNNDNDFIVVRDENGKRYQVIPQERYLELTTPPNDKEIEKWKREDYDKMSKETLIQIMVDKDDYFEELKTPPTEQELCEALGEYLKRKVYYEEQEFGTSFYLGKVKKDMNGKEYTVKRTIVVSYEGEIGWNVSLPPHLITIIGRFYEGKVKEND